jgi:hypothetical protein
LLKVDMSADTAKPDISIYAGNQVPKFGVDVGERCSELSVGEVVFFAGFPIAKNPDAVFIEGTSLASQARHLTDVQAGAEECAELAAAKYEVDPWWSSNEWTELRAWVQAELDGEGDEQLQMQMAKLDLWVVGEEPAVVDFTGADGTDVATGGEAAAECGAVESECKEDL